MRTTVIIFIFYYLIINILLLAAMYLDKQKAIKEKRRIKEMTLFILSLLGGGIGGFIGMFAFHHKTKKPLFYFVFTICILLHISFVYFLFHTLFV